MASPPPPPHPAAPAGAQSRADWLPHALLLLGLGLLLVLLAGVTIWQERVRQHERAVASTHNLARLLEAHVADVLTKADVLLLASALQWRELAQRGDPEAAAGALRALAAALPRLQNLQVAGIDGRWQLRPDLPPAQQAAADSVDSATAAALQRLQADRSAGLGVQGPLQRAPGQPWVLALSRAVNDSQGRLIGLVSIDLPVDRFDTVFSAIDLGEQGAATIRTEGRLALVYRRPWPKEGMAAAVGRTDVSVQLREALAADPVAGDYGAPTALDGIARINAYRKVGNYPLILLVGLPESEFPRGWNTVDLAVVTLALATLGLAGLALAALLRLQRRALGAAQRQMAAIVESSQDAIISENRDGVITSWNAGAERMFGWPAAEMLGQSINRVLPADLRAESVGLMARVLRGEPVAHVETERLCRDGRRLAVSVSISPVYDDAGQLVGTARIARDISAQKALAEEVRQLAFHDPLTRLPNRRLLMDRLRHAQQASRRQGTHGAVLFLDLDGFKQLNDRLGHEAGDQRLVQVADTLRQAVRATDTVARLGGDEFVVVCEQLDADPARAEEALQALQAKIADLLARPVLLAGQLVSGASSIGLRLFLGCDEPPERLLADADAAMYRQKQARRAQRPSLPVLEDADSDFSSL